MEERRREHSVPVRQSTGIVYEVKWAIFCDWCSGRDIDPVRVTVQQLADFLVFILFRSLQTKTSNQ
jgi:hypothetical protein